MEFNKCPTNIDKAVNDVVSYTEMKKKVSISAHKVRMDLYSSSSEDERNDYEVARGLGRPPTFRPENGKPKQDIPAQKDDNQTIQNPPQQPGHISPQCNSRMVMSHLQMLFRYTTN